MDPGLVYQPQGKAHHYVNNVKILIILFLLNLFWYFNEFLQYIVKQIFKNNSDQNFSFA